MICIFNINLIMKVAFPWNSHLTLSNVTHTSYDKLNIVYGAWQLWDPFENSYKLMYKIIV